jgi:hypothetical protein
LKKQEALAVLHEVVDVLRDSVVIDCVSLDYNSSQVSKDPDNAGFLIRIKCDLDNYVKGVLTPILSKHNLALKEDKGFIVIFPC